MLQAGQPYSVVQALVGHKSPAITERYTHVGDEALTSAIKSLPAMVRDGQGIAETVPVVDRDEQIRELLEGATGETWEETRSRVLELLANRQQTVQTSG